MKVIDCTFETFAVRSRGKKIVAFGAGAMGKILFPYICGEYGLEEKVLFFIDNDKGKIGNVIHICNKEKLIYPVEKLINLDKENLCIVITNGDFYSVIQQLNEFADMENVECYLLAVMQIFNGKGTLTKIVENIGEKPQIPKIIHYCWFSGNPIPDNLKYCMESWYKYCPDYQFMRWDETTYNLDKYIYTKQAYQQRRWGYIPDVIRLDVLYEYGGIYLDTDVELLKSLDELRVNEAFCGREQWGHVNFGGGSGCIKGHALIGEILNFRKNIPFMYDNGKLNLEASGYYETMPLIKHGLHIVDKTEDIRGMRIYASEYFHPYNYITGKEMITAKTVSIHRFNGGWLGKEGLKNREETRKRFDTIVSKMVKK